MLEALRTRAALRRKAGEIYGAIVTQARQRGFYAALGIPDTPAGRYDMVVLHLFLVLERLRLEAGTEPLQQALIEAFVSDMDDSLRELGTGDVVVGKKVRRAAAGFYERARDYRAALAPDGNGALQAVLVQHGLAPANDPIKRDALAGYVREAVSALTGQDGPSLLAGTLTFPPPPHLAGEGS
jgi:cytochrome b pre-mRNA-processing protein 3